MADFPEDSPLFVEDAQRRERHLQGGTLRPVRDDHAQPVGRPQAVERGVRQRGDDRRDEGLLELVADLAVGLVVDHDDQRVLGTQDGRHEIVGDGQAGKTSCLREKNSMPS